MTATGEQLKCVCGMAMMPTAGGGEGWCCPNCDALQPQEPHGLSRRKSKWDVRYDMYWVRVVDTEYVDNTQPDEPAVGTTNPAPEEETSTDNEGDTNEDGN